MLFLLSALGLFVILLWRQYKTNVLKLKKRFKGTVWLLIISHSAVLSLYCGECAWKWLNKIPQNFSELISGSIAYSQSVKAAEYGGLYIAIGVFCLAFVLLIKLYDCILNEPTPSSHDTEKLLTIALFPFFILIGQTLRMSNTYYLLQLSTFSVLSVNILVYVLHFLRENNFVEPKRTFQVGAKLGLGIVFWLLSNLGLSIFLSRIKITAYPTNVIAVIILLLQPIYFILSVNPPRNGNFHLKSV